MLPPIIDYPPAADPVTASSGNVANAAATATIAAVAGQRNWLTGFFLSGSGATAASVISVTVTGLIGGTMTFAYAVPSGVTAKSPDLHVTFPKPIPATGPNVAIVASAPGFGAGNTNATMVATGFRMTE